MIDICFCLLHYFVSQRKINHPGNAGSFPYYVHPINIFSDINIYIYTYICRDHKHILYMAIITYQNSKWFCIPKDWCHFLFTSTIHHPTRFSDLEDDDFIRRLQVSLRLVTFWVKKKTVGLCPTPWKHIYMCITYIYSITFVLHICIWFLILHISIVFY
jgi:hypothetical protein